MLRVVRGLAGVALAVLTGSAIGLATGLPCGLVTYGLGSMLGLAVGGAAGAVAGALAAADRGGRLAGRAAAFGGAFGLLAVAGVLVRVTTYGPVLADPQFARPAAVTGAELAMVGGYALAQGAFGWLAGRSAEWVGRAVAGTRPAAA